MPVRKGDGNKGEFSGSCVLFLFLFNCFFDDRLVEMS